MKARAQVSTVARAELTPLESAMSKHQLEQFLDKAAVSVSLQQQIDQCGADNSCVVALAREHGHSFSSATLSRWQRDQA